MPSNDARPWLGSLTRESAIGPDIVALVDNNISYRVTYEPSVKETKVRSGN